jgi:hypothetical protein
MRLTQVEGISILRSDSFVFDSLPNKKKIKIKPLEWRRKCFAKGKIGNSPECSAAKFGVRYSPTNHKSANSTIGNYLPKIAFYKGSAIRASFILLKVAIGYHFNFLCPYYNGQASALQLIY